VVICGFPAGLRYADLRLICGDLRFSGRPFNFAADSGKKRICGCATGKMRMQMQIHIRILPDVFNGN